MTALDQTEHPLTRKGRELSVRVAELAGGQLVVFGAITDGCLVRIHSRCLYGDVLQSDDCDCGPELGLALDMIQDEGSGVLIYLDQEGRGAGLVNKARGLQTGERLGIDTFASYEQLGVPADSRCFKLAAETLGILGLKSVRLLTSNSEKVLALREAGIEVTVVDLPTEPRSERARAYQQAVRRHRRGTARPSILQPMYDHAALMDERHGWAGKKPTVNPLPPPELPGLWASVLAAIFGRWRR